MDERGEPRIDADERGEPRINADERGLAHRAITENVIGGFYEVYNDLKSGYAESVYEGSMEIALRDRGLLVERQPSLVVRFRGIVVGEFRPDLVVESAVIVELKAAKAIDSSHEAQLLNYLRASDLEIGLLFNFGPQPSFKRMIFSNSRNKDPRSPASIRGPTSS